MAAGVSVSHIAARLQRTERGIHAQIRNLIPEDAEVGRPVTQGREDWLRQKLAVNPGYNWRDVLRSRTDNDSLLLWTKSEDEQLRAGWHEATPLPQLAARLRISETLISRRLVSLGLAAHVAEVVDRLGATPGGSVEARARSMRGELAEALYVLVVKHDRRPKVTIHHSRVEAEAQLQRILETAAQPGPRWWVLQRSLDGRDIGQWWTNPGQYRIPQQRQGDLARTDAARK
jgi:hypothetical protein